MTSGPIPPEEVERAAAYVSRSTGTSFEGSRNSHLLRQVAMAMQRAGCQSAAEYQLLLEKSPVAFGDLAEKVTVGESYFFRDPAQLAHLRKEILPELARRREGSGPLRFWSAGCSTGQEPYTLAIVLEEEGLASRSRILGSDLSAPSLAAARTGLYPQWSLRTTSETQRRAYFRREGTRYRLEERITRMVSFRTINLLDPSDHQPGGMDVVLCRNVLIYLTPEAVGRAVRRLTESLAPGGWLLTAPTDPSLNGVEGLERVPGRAGVAYRRTRPDGSAASPLHRPRSGSRGEKPAADRPGAFGLAGGTAGHETRPQAGDPGTPAASASPQDATAGEAGAEAQAALVRVLADTGRLKEAVLEVEAGVARFPVDVHLRYLHAVALLETGRAEEAAVAADAALYLRPDLAVAHLARARVALALGDMDGARRCFRNARTLLRELPADQMVELADGEPAGRMAAAVEAHERLTVDPVPSRVRTGER